MVLETPNFFSNYYLFSTFLILTLIIFLILGTTIRVDAQVQGQGIVGFYANMSSNEEVPPNESNATGLAVFLFKNDSSKLSYLVNSTGLNEITQSNIYNGSAGMNGEAVVPLSDEKSQTEKKNSSIQYQGQIKSDDLIGTLDGKEIIDLVDLMSNGSAYVNIHTEQHIYGAIRGQIVMGQVQMNGDAITGLAVPGGLIGLSGISLQGGSIIFSPGGIIGFISIPVTGGSQTGGGNGNAGGTVGGVGDGIGGVVNQLGETVDEAADKLSGTVDKATEYVGEEAGNIASTVDDTDNIVDNTLEKIDEGIVQKILDNDGDSKDSDSGDSKDSDSGDSKDSDSGDSKDSDSGDSKDSDSGDSKDSDDGGDSVKDTVKRLSD